jgi:predicted acylesterase/phospholipase RssA
LIRSTRIQVAIQGGAAKLGALFAAGEALQTLEAGGSAIPLGIAKAPPFEVTRLAGTSAGSIVAALYAVHKAKLGSEGFDSIERVRRDIVDKHRGTIAKAFPKRGTLAILYDVMRGRPIYDLHVLRDLLARYIPPNVTFDALRTKGVDLFVLAADLDSRCAKTYGPDPRQTPSEEVLRAVLISSALPYVFATHANFRSTLAHAVVDGGLCENLPHRPLQDAQGELSNGKILGFSFPSTLDEARPSGPIEFGLRLVDTAVHNSVARAREAIGREYLFDIDTTIKGSDLAKVPDLLAATPGEYGEIKLRAMTWTADRILVLSSLPVQGTYAGSTSAVPDPSAVMTSVNSTFLKLRKRFPYETRRAALIVEADTLWRDPTRKRPADRVTRLAWVQPQEELVVYRVDLGEYDSRSTDIVTLEARDANGTPVGVQAVRAVEQGPRGERTLSVMFFGENVPQDRCPVEIVKTTHIKNVLDLITQSGKTEDYLSLTVSREFAHPLEHVDIVCFLPDEFFERHNPVFEQPTPAESMQEFAAKDEDVPRGSAMAQDEVFRLYRPSFAGYRALGWRCTNVQPGASVIARMRLQR